MPQTLGQGTAADETQSGGVRTPVSLREAIARFVTLLPATHERSRHTMRAYEGDLCQLSTSVGPVRALESVRVDDVVRWLSELQGAGYAASSRRRKLAATRAFFRWCVEGPHLRHNPLDGAVVRIAVPRALPRCLPEEETERILTVLADGASLCRGVGPRVDRAAQACRDRAIVETMLSTGMRVGEVAMLGVSDVDTRTGRLLVHGKGRRERTALVADVVALQALRHYCEHRSALGVTTSRLFVNRRLQAMTTQGMAYAVRRLGLRACVERRITPHMLRHTAAILLLKAGANLRIVQEFLGHASIVMTERYTHVSPMEVEESVRAHGHLARLRSLA